MSKEFERISFDARQCKVELTAFRKLLDTEDSLSERADLHSFFRERKQLSALLFTYASGIPADLLAFEFPFLGDFIADLVVGNQQSKTFCIVEMEDARPDSVFRKVANRMTTEWSPRFEHGFSQLVDWSYVLDDFKKTDRFARDFGHGHIRFHAMLLLGRNSGISEPDRRRLRWRAEKVRVDSHSFECLTFDDLYDHLQTYLSLVPDAATLET